MRDGFVKVAARTPEVRVADVDFNTKAILEEVRRAHEDDDAKLVVLPELCVTAYTCEDLFWQEALLDAAERAIGTIVRATADYEMLLFFGAPVRVNDKLYNCAIAASAGEG